MELLKQEHSKHPDNPYLFPSPVTSGMYHPDSVVKLHQKILKDAGLDVIHVRVRRDGFISPLTKEQQQHPSETALDFVEPDHFLLNDGTVNNLKQQIQSLLNEWHKRGRTI